MGLSTWTKPYPAEQTQSRMSRPARAPRSQSESTVCHWSPAYSSPAVDAEWELASSRRNHVPTRRLTSTNPTVPKRSAAGADRVLRLVQVATIFSEFTATALLNKKSTWIDQG